MPEEAEQEQQPEVNPEIEKLKADFRKEMDDWKASLSKELEAKDEQIKKLTEANDGLRASLVRNATTQPVEPVKEKTPEEIYKEQVDYYAEKTLNKMKQELVGDKHDRH